MVEKSAAEHGDNYCRARHINSLYAGAYAVSKYYIHLLINDLWNGNPRDGQEMYVVEV